MTKRKKRRQADTIVLLRYGVGLLIAIHGAARIGYGIVDDFGLFLEGEGVPYGIALAYVVTAMEVVGGLGLILNKGTIVIAPWFIVQLLSGIFLVHWEEGWFVVGAGRNGMEFSVLLIFCLLVILRHAIHSLKWP